MLHMFNCYYYLIWDRKDLYIGVGGIYLSYQSLGLKFTSISFTMLSFIVKIIVCMVNLDAKSQLFLE